MELRNWNRWQFYGVFWATGLLVAAVLWPENGTWSNFGRVNSQGTAVLITPPAIALGCGLIVRLSLAVLACLTAFLCARAGYGQAWLFVALTFPVLLHSTDGIALLLVLPMIFWFTREGSPTLYRTAIAAGLAAGASLLNPAAIVIAGVLVGGAAVRTWWRVSLVSTIVFCATHLALSRFAGLHSAVASLPNEISLESAARSIFSVAPSWPASIGMWAMLIAGTWLLLTKRRPSASGRIAVTSIGLSLIAVWVILYQDQLWSSHNPFENFVEINSLIAIAPWLALLVFPPYKGGRIALQAALALAVIALFFVPNTDPHLLPFSLMIVLPLFLLDLVHRRLDSGLAFAVLVGVSAIQLVSLSVLIANRGVETHQHVQLLESKIGSPLVCSPPQLAAEIEPLITSNAIYGARGSDELVNIASEFRASGVDTFYLLADAHDSVYVKAFPGGRPCWPQQMTITQGGFFKPTYRRLMKLVTNPSDSAWTKMSGK